MSAAVVITTAGAVLLVVSLVWLFGAVALGVVGVTMLGLGLFVDWDKVT